MKPGFFYPARRVPQSFPPSYVRRKLLPFWPRLLGNTITTAVADHVPLPPAMHDMATERAKREGEEILEDSQRIFFDEPGLDTLLVRAVSTFARRVTAVGRLYLKARIKLHMDRHGRAATMLPLVPERGYDSLMTGMLAVGTALGYFRGGAIHVEPFWDSAADQPELRLPPGHPRPAVRRHDAPDSLAAMAADIDDLYWAEAYGQAIKVTRVGAGDSRRWLVSLPGTDHMGGDATPNPADNESNIREVLNVPSAMRLATIRAIHLAMEADGVPEERRCVEPVFIVGHSQGGMVATALAAADPQKIGLNVTAVLGEGSPSRRIRIRDDVTMVSVVHDQDVIPSMDGTPQHSPDHRVMVGRRLVRPRRSPLYYAHSSSTYTETVQQLERRTRIAPWGRVAAAVQTLQGFLPAEGDETRVFLFDAWQELLEAGNRTFDGRQTWDAYVALERAEDWEPADFQEEWAPNPLVEIPELKLPEVHLPEVEWPQTWEDIEEVPWVRRVRARLRRDVIDEGAAASDTPARPVQDVTIEMEPGGADSPVGAEAADAKERRNGE